MTRDISAKMTTVPDTPHLGVRVAREKQDAAYAKAKRHRDTVSRVVNEAIDDYIGPQVKPGDTVYLTGLKHGDDGLYVVEEGPIHGTLGETVVTLRKVEP
jgi:hypothetical protein